MHRYLMVTGHRPNRMGDEDWLRRVFEQLFTQLDFQRGLSGMAWGTDIVFCEVCRENGQVYDAIIPYDRMHERWPMEWKVRYHDAVNGAQDRAVVAQEYTPSVYMRRNRLLVNRAADALVVWDGQKEGGTWGTIQMLEERGLSWVWINPVEKSVRRRRTPTD